MGGTALAANEEQGDLYIDNANRAARENTMVRITTEAEDEAAVKALPAWRRTLFPVLNFEITKVLTMMLMMFSVCFTYAVLRDTKEAFALEKGGPSKIFMLKSVVVLPFSFIFVVLFQFMDSKLKKRKLFFTVVLSFLAFFCVHSIFPQNGSSKDAGREIIGKMLKYDEKMIMDRKLTGVVFNNACDIADVFLDFQTSSFFMMSEMWGSIVLSLMFFTYTNSICGPGQASRFYPCMSLGSNIALIAVAVLTKLFFVQDSSSLQNINKIIQECLMPSNMSSANDVRFKFIMMVILSGMLFLFSYHWMETRVMTNPLNCQKGVKKVRSTKKPSFLKGLSMCFTTFFLAATTFIVIAYGVSTNIAEGAYKKSYEMASRFDSYILMDENSSSIKTGIIDEINKMPLEKKQEFLKKHSRDTDKITPEESNSNNYMIQEIAHSLVEKKIESLKKRSYKSSENLMTGCISLFLLLAIGNRSVSFFGWRTTAFVCPVAMAITGVTYMVFAQAGAQALNDHKGYDKARGVIMDSKSKVGIAKEFREGKLTSGWFNTPVNPQFEVYFGMFTVCLGKSVKYIFFDPTKEMLFIRMPSAVKSKAKGVVDVIGSRLGKSSGSIFQMACLMFMQSQRTQSNQDIRLVLSMLLFLLVIFYALWLTATAYLSRKYADSEKSPEKLIDTGIVLEDELEAEKVVA